MVGLTVGRARLTGRRDVTSRSGEAGRLEPAEVEESVVLLVGKFIWKTNLDDE
jgi:hypothetical protein